MRFLAWLLTFAGTLLFTSSAPAAAAVTNGGPVYHHAAGVVYIDGSHLTGAWPAAVRWAAAQWDKGTDVSVRYGPCRAGAGCVRVLDTHRGRHAPPGQTVYWWYTGTMTLVEPAPTTTTSRFDLDYPYWTPRDRYFAACHEVGRGLGIEYAWPTWQGSCMYRQLGGWGSIYPAQADRDALNRAYS